MLLDRLVYKPMIDLARRLKKDLIIYNSRFNYWFIITHPSSYNIMMLTHEGDVPNYLLEFIKKAENEIIFIDVGAHQGAYTLALAPYCKLIVAIEPHPDNYRILVKNLILNRIENCIPVKCAAYSSNGETILYLSQSEDLHSIYKCGVEHQQYIRVPAYKLDNLLLDRLKLEKVDVVKIDVEGAEVEVLEGMQDIIRKFNPLIVIEVFQKNLDKVSVYLKQHTYAYMILYKSVDPITNEEYRYLLAYRTSY